ncbi:hypothetical protein RFI_25269 [Reticulomyxa filosa]|uniref:Uncharacterized protein n=1 Tax=Reticulomyxa filosa TaxID=46433 RepID=X6MDZ0_RETFI|nr:hypothetical protein RFI_25269 [Reticulomyxa filosa]|eukprot:ETO12109.1 hypothetical protein RFI_25269 [Reticulomyxa filosa]
MDGLIDKDYHIHERNASSIAKIALKWNEKQLNDAINYFINRFNCEKRDDKYAGLLEGIAQRLDEK